MNLSRILLICLFGWYSQAIWAADFLSENALDSVEYTLFYEIMVYDNPPAVQGLPGIEKYKASPPKLKQKVKRSSPLIILIPVKSSRPGFPELTLNSSGVFLADRKVCEWRNKKYDARLEHGEGVMLEGCPSWVPFRTYNDGRELGEVKIVLSIPFTKKDGDKITVKLFDGMEFQGQLPKLRGPWRIQASREKTELPKLKYVASIESGLTSFLKEIRGCLAREKWDPCIRSFLPNVGAFSVWDSTVEESPIYCPGNKKFKNLRSDEYIKCLQQIDELKSEIRLCTSRDPNSYQNIWLKGEMAALEGTANLKELIEDKSRLLEMEFDGVYFKCVVKRQNGKWLFYSLNPNFRRIISDQADGVLRVEGPSFWPFQKIDQVETGVSLENYYILKK